MRIARRKCFAVRPLVSEAAVVSGYRTVDPRLVLYWATPGRVAKARKAGERSIFGQAQSRWQKANGAIARITIIHGPITVIRPVRRVEAEHRDNALLQIAARAAAGDEPVIKGDVHATIAIEIADERPAVLRGLVAIGAEQPP